MSTSEIKAAIDQRLEDALAASNYRITLGLQKKNAQLKLEKGLTYSINGGTFKITTELISFTHALISMEHDDAILLDVNKNPIEIKDLKQFNEELVNRYYEHMNSYLAEHRAIQKCRTVKALVGE